MESDQKQDTWNRISSWYRKTSGGKAPPSRGHMDRIATDRAELYRFRPPEGLRVPVMVTPEEVEDGVPEKAEILQAVRGLKGGRAGGLSGMRA